MKCFEFKRKTKLIEKVKKLTYSTICVLPTLYSENEKVSFT